MTGQVPRSFDPERNVGVLHAHGVRYALVGGLATTLHGSPAVTYDVDLAVEATSGGSPPRWSSWERSATPTVRDRWISRVLFAALAHIIATKEARDAIRIWRSCPRNVRCGSSGVSETYKDQECHNG